MEETRNAPYFNEEDRISKLPDEIIHYIMSFNDTKYAVQTSVLSKRWKNTWKSLPILRFDRNSFPNDKSDSFISFLDMVLCFRKEIDIQKFSMEWRNSAYDTVMLNVTRWSFSAVKYNVKDFRMVITEIPNSAYEISHHLLNCKSLTKLEIVLAGHARYADTTLPRQMNLPQLKELILRGLSISDVESSTRLFSSCPVLQTLRIQDCAMQTDNRRNFIVDSVSLKELEYTCFYRHLVPQKDTMANIIKLCAPNLKHFTFTSLFTHGYSLENSSPLYSVRFFMKLKAIEGNENAETYSKLPSMEKDVYAERMMNYLGAIYVVKEMRLSPGFLEVISRAPDLISCQHPRLCNLEYLVLDMWSTRGCFRAIAYLLKISPNIIKLDLNLKELNLADVGDGWEEGLSLTGMLSRLVLVRIKEVEGCDNELRFLRYLLKNVMSLKALVMYPHSTIGSTDSVRKQFIDKVRALPRASSHIKMLWLTKNIH